MEEEDHIPLQYQWEASHSSGWLSLSLVSDFEEDDDAAVAFLLNAAQQCVEQQGSLPRGLILDLDRDIQPTVVPGFVQFLNMCQITTMRLEASSINPVHVVAGLGQVTTLKRVEYSGPSFDPVARLLLETVSSRNNGGQGIVNSLFLRCEARGVEDEAMVADTELLLESLSGALQNGTSCLKSLHLSHLPCSGCEDMVFAALRPCTSLEQLRLDCSATDSSIMKFVANLVQSLPALTRLNVTFSGSSEEHGWTEDDGDGLSRLFDALSKHGRLEKLILPMAKRDTPRVLPFLKRCCETRAVRSLELRCGYLSVSSFVARMKNVASLHLADTNDLGIIFSSPATCAIVDLKLASVIHGSDLENMPWALREYKKLTSLRLRIGPLYAGFSLERGLCPQNRLQVLDLGFSDRAHVLLTAQLLQEQTHLRHLVVKVCCTLLNGAHTDAMDQLNKALQEHPTLQTISLVALRSQQSVVAGPKVLATFLNGIKKNPVLQVLDLSSCDKVDMECLVDLIKQTKRLSGLCLPWKVVNHQEMDQFGAALRQNRTICVVRTTSCMGAFFNRGHFHCDIVESLCHNQQYTVPSGLWCKILWRINDNQVHVPCSRRDTDCGHEENWVDDDDDEGLGGDRFHRHLDITGIFLFVRKGASFFADTVGGTKKRPPLS